MNNLRHMLLLLWTTFCLGQQVEISPFLNGASGAYTLSHDNFCMDLSGGIITHADSIARSKNIPFAFTAVTSYCDSVEWSKAVDMIAYGHEIANGSHSQRCGLPVSWCPETYYDSSDYAVEFDLSHELIVKKTGQKPAYYCFPYTLHNKKMIDYLSKMGYSFTRSGPQFGNNHPKLMDLRRVGYQIYRPEENYEELNKLVDEAIKDKQWAFRVLHGVEDSSWASIPLGYYSAHLDYLRTKVNSGELWVATPTPIISYLVASKSARIESLCQNINRSVYKIKSEFKDQKLTIRLRRDKRIQKVIVSGEKEDFVLKEDGYYITALPDQKIKIYWHRARKAPTTSSF